MRLPTVVTCAATLCVRAVSGMSRSCFARAANCTSAATLFVRTTCKRAEHLELLHVLREVAARHALVDVLVAGQFAELLDARLHIVPRDALALHDAAEIHRVLHPLVALDHASRER